MYSGFCRFDKDLTVKVKSCTNVLTFDCACPIYYKLGMISLSSVVSQIYYSCRLIKSAMEMYKFLPWESRIDAHELSLDEEFGMQCG